MIISVPSSLNLSHRSLVSSLQPTSRNSSELHRSSRTGSAAVAAAVVTDAADGGRGGGLHVDDDMITSSAECAAVVVSPLNRRFLCGFSSESQRNKTKKKKNTYIIIFPFGQISNKYRAKSFESIDIMPNVRLKTIETYFEDAQRVGQ